MAVYLGISLTAVRNRLHDARRKIKKEFAHMLKDTVHQQRLPDDFTTKVVDEALQQGQAALADGAWQKARESFLRALDLQPDSQPAFQGLGEAAVEDIVERLAQPNATIQREQLDQAFADAEQAYRLGGRDVKTAMELAGSSVPPVRRDGGGTVGLCAKERRYPRRV
jgi:tetratricopeptide (TPR) repeat protein